MYDGKFIEFPEFADECRTDASWGLNPETTHDCGNPKDGYLKIGVWSGFPDKWPNAYKVVQRMNFTNLDVAQFAMYVDIDDMEPEDAAAKWLANNCARWTGWASADQSVCPEAPTAAPAAGVPGLVEEGKLIVVTTGNFPPFTAIDPDSGDVVGYTIDIARSVAERLGLELETPTVDWVNELEGLAQGLYDIADSGIWPTAKRQESFLFSRPITSTGIVAQVRTEDAGGPGFADMTGMKAGGIQGSSQEAYMLENADALGYESYSGFAGAGEALTALKQGRVDALSQDTLVAGFASVNDPELAVAGPTVLAHPLSLAFQLGQEAKRDAVNAALDAMIADGTLAELQKKWFNTCIPVPDHNNQEEPYTTMPAGDC
jgi:ABC-type amino acid transport substrate-binding protein